MKSTSPICKSSFKMSSPPLSPSTNAVVVLFLLNSPIDWGTLTPSTATVFLIPYLSKFKTSLRPSTTIIASEEWILGPAGKWSSPYSEISWIRIASLTSSIILMLVGPTLSTMFL